MSSSHSVGDRSTLPAVSALVVNWNGGALLARCVASARAAGAEVVVVDNASTDGSAEADALRAAGVCLVRERENRGFAGGVNIAARHASADRLLLLNPDTRIEASAIAALGAALDARPDAAAAGACLVDEDGRPQRGFTVRRFPTLASLATDLLLIDEVWPGNPARRHYLALDVPLDGPSPVEVEQPAAACLMVRRDVFAALGGLDERYHPAWFEDVDFCRRLRDAGHVVLFVPGARVVHAGGVSLRSLGAQDFARAWYRNLRRYVARHHGRAQALAVDVLIAVGMALRAAVGAVTGHRTRREAALAVLRDLLTGGGTGVRS